MNIINEYEILVIGAGPAGLMAAGICAKDGKKVLVLDKNDKTARKLRITGKGRCNLTNNCPPEEFISSTITNGKFLYAAAHSFTAQDTMSFFESLGVPLKTERGNRVFPVSDNANDIADTLSNFVLLNKGKIIKSTVKSVEKNDDFFLVKTNDKVYSAKKVLIASGGASYTATGSTGDGYAFAKKLGHSVKPLRPSLIALVSKDEFCGEMQGLSLKNCSVKVVDNTKNKVIYKDFGELLFTHFGVSGPVILSASAHMKDMEEGRYTLFIDLKPALDEKTLDLRILRDFDENSNKNFENSLSGLLPKSMIDVIIALSGIDPKKKCNEINKTERRHFLNLLKNLKIDIEGFRPINEAIITSGGVNVREINPKTMASKLVDGLYFAGEVIDLDAYTGGFNLQIAFSTAYLAAQSMLEN